MTFSFWIVAQRWISWGALMLLINVYNIGLAFLINIYISESIQANYIWLFFHLRVNILF